MQPHLEKAGFEEEALPCLDVVYRFALRLSGGDEAAAADLVQETFLRAYRAWDTYTRATRILSWLFTICHNVALRQKQRQRLRPETTLTDLNVEGIESLRPSHDGRRPGPQEAESAYFDSIVDEQILRTVDALPAEYREVVVLRDLHDYSYDEIAAILRIPRGTVKSRLHRARSLLIDALSGYAREIGFLRSDVAPPPA